MASLNLDLNYFDHVKTLRLAARLGPGSEVIPVRLWTYAGKHHPEDGKLALLEAELEHVCAWWGEKGAMVPALVEIGFLEKFGEFFQVHDWLDHSGHLAAFKKRAKNAAKKRWSHNQQSSNATSIAKAETKQCPSSAVHSSSKQSNPPTPLTTSPSATPPTSTAPENGNSTARGGGLKPAGNPLSTLKINGKPYVEPVVDEEPMTPEEMEAIKRANMVPQAVPGGHDDVF